MATLNVNSTLQCPHGGSVQITPGQSRLSADQGVVATQADTFVISGCPFQIPSTPPIPSPCIQVMWVVADVRTKAGSIPTLSTNSSGICMAATGLPQGPVSVVNTQAKVSSS